MARIGFLVMPGYGHILPSLGLALALQSRGHEVLYYGIEHFRDRLEREGVAFVPIPLALKGEAPFKFNQYRRILQHFRRMIDLTIDWGPGRVQHDGVELLVIDQSVVSGRTLAEVSGLPFVTLCFGLHLRRDRRGRLPPLFTPWPPGSTAAHRLRNRVAFAVLDGAALPVLHHLNRRRRALGLPPHRRLDDSFSRQAFLTQVPEAFEPFEVEDRQPFHLVGPLSDFVQREARERSQEPAFPFARLEGRRVLYVSFGLDGRVTHDLYRSVLEGSEGMGFTRVVSAGLGPVPEALKRFEDAETIIVPHAPQVAILRQASLVVSHGGMNGVLESLFFGRPMLVMPFCCDQPGIAARVRWAGAGLVVPAKKASPDRVRQALIRLRDEPAWRERAQALASSLMKAGGARRAADVIEGILSSAGAAGSPSHSSAAHS